MIKSPEEPSLAGSEVTEKNKDKNQNPMHIFSCFIRRETRKLVTSWCSFILPSCRLTALKQTQNIQSLETHLFWFRKCRVRNAHEKNISQRRRYFGIQAEQLHLLRRLRESVIGVWRLNISTAIIVFVATILSAFWNYGPLKGTR